MIVTDEKLAIKRYTAEYELLRSQVTGPSGSVTPDQPRGLGLAVFLRDGMPGWLRNVAVAIVPQTAESTATDDARSQGSIVVERLPHTQRQEIATLLASLVLSTLPVAHPSSREAYR